MCWCMSVLHWINGTLFKMTTANAFVQWCVWLVMIRMMETMRSYWWDPGNWQESFKTSKVWQQSTVFLVTLRWSFCTLTPTFTVIVGSSFAPAGFFKMEKKLVAKYYKVLRYYIGPSDLFTQLCKQAGENWPNTLNMRTQLFLIVKKKKKIKLSWKVWHLDYFVQTLDVTRTPFMILNVRIPHSAVQKADSQPCSICSEVDDSLKDKERTWNDRGGKMANTKENKE